MDYMIYEDSPKYNFWLKLFPLFILAAVAMTIFNINYVGLKGSSSIQYIVISIVVLILAILIYGARLHRKYQIFGDRLKIVRWLPFHTEIPFKNVDAASEVNSDGVKKTYDILLLSNTNSIKITGKGWGPSFTFAPRNREEFLRRLNDALSYWKSKNPDRDIKG